MKTILLLFATVLLTVAATAETFDVTLFYNSDVGGKTLKQGNCKVKVDDNGHVEFWQGRKSVEADAKVETVDTPFERTSVHYNNGNGRYSISEIRVGGTTTKLVFN